MRRGAPARGAGGRCTRQLHASQASRLRYGTASLVDSTAVLQPICGGHMRFMITAGMRINVGCHTFKATGISAYLEAGH